MGSIKDIMPSGTIEYDRKRMTAKRIMLCDDYLNYATYVPKIGDIYPGDSRLLCVRVRVQGEGRPVDDAEHPNYEYARIEVDYADRLAELDGAAILSWDSQPDTIILPGSLTWASDGVSLADEGLDGLVQRVQSRRILTAEKCVTYMSEDAIMMCEGKVNASSWKPATGPTWYAPGTVRFDGCPCTQEFDSLYGYIYRMSYKFTFNPWGWNNIYRAVMNTYEPTNPLLYETANFVLLGV